MLSFWEGLNYMKNSSKKLLSVSEAAKFKKVSPDTIRRWRREGKLNGYQRSNGYWVYDPDELDKIRVITNR